MPVRRGTASAPFLRATGLREGVETPASPASTTQGVLAQISPLLWGCWRGVQGVPAARYPVLSRARAHAVPSGPTATRTPHSRDPKPGLIWANIIGGVSLLGLQWCCVPNR